MRAGLGCKDMRVARQMPADRPEPLSRGSTSVSLERVRIAPLKETTMLSTRLSASLAGLAAVALGGIGPAAAGADTDSHADSRDHGRGRTVHAQLVDRTGAAVGRVTVSSRRGVAQVELRASHLTPGWHGFHLHSVGRCEGDFTSAGSHLNPDGAQHPDHAGDLPQMLVRQDGRATLSFATDRFTAAWLLDQDGSAFIVHSSPDNYANIPTRYAPMRLPPFDGHPDWPGSE